MVVALAAAAPREAVVEAAATTTAALVLMAGAVEVTSVEVDTVLVTVVVGQRCGGTGGSGGAQLVPLGACQALLTVGWTVVHSLDVGWGPVVKRGRLGRGDGLPMRVDSGEEDEAERAGDEAEAHGGSGVRGGESSDDGVRCECVRERLVGLAVMIESRAAGNGRCM